MAATEVCHFMPIRVPDNTEHDGERVRPKIALPVTYFWRPSRGVLHLLRAASYAITTVGAS